MINKQHYFNKMLLIIILIPCLLLFTSTELSARSHSKNVSHSKTSKKKKGRKSRHPKRCYNPSLTRAQAVEIIRNTSEEVSQLAGLKPKVEDQGSVTLPGNSGQNEVIEGEEGENIAELEAEDDVTVDIETFKMLWLSYLDDGTNDENGMTQGGVPKKEIMSTIMDWLGTPYRFGARSRIATDCSAFTQSIFSESCDILLPRTARDQYMVGMKVPAMKDLKFGDLVFFHTYSKRFASHVGIYLGDDLFAHASSRYGVTVSSLESTFYNNRFIGGRRISTSDMVKVHKTSDDSDEN